MLLARVQEENLDNLLLSWDHFFINPLRHRAALSKLQVILIQTWDKIRTPLCKRLLSKHENRVCEKNSSNTGPSTCLTVGQKSQVQGLAACKSQVWNWKMRNEVCNWVLILAKFCKNFIWCFWKKTVQKPCTIFTERIPSITPFITCSRQKRLGTFGQMLEIVTRWNTKKKGSMHSGLLFCKIAVSHLLSAIT